MVDSKALINRKLSVDPKLLQSKICLRNNQNEQAPEKFNPVFTKITKRFDLLFARDKNLIPEELKKQLVDAIHFGLPSSTKILAQRNIP